MALQVNSNPWRAKDAPPAKVEDFLPDFEPKAKPKKSPKELREKFHALMKLKFGDAAGQG